MESAAHNEMARIESFSDGVYAIAITLLVLTITVPAVASIHSSSDLWHQLGQLWPSFFAFVLSFGIILVSWVNHHGLFTLLRKSSPTFLFANGFLLFGVVLAPFSTMLLADYIMTDYAQPAVVFYSFTSLLQNLGWYFVTIAVIKSGLLKETHVVIAEFNRRRRYALVGLAIYSFTLIISWWFPMTAVGLIAALWMLWMILGLTSKRVDVSQA